MGRKYKKNKNKIWILAGFLLVVFCISLGVGGTIDEDSLLKILLRQGKSQVYQKMLETYSPSILYEGKAKEVKELLIEKIFQTIPVYGYVTSLEEYETQVESSISYETIIAREAADENYVNEHGEVVTGEKEVSTEEVAPQTEEPPKENTPEEAPAEEVTVAQAPPVQKAAAPPNGFVPNNTPVVSYSMDKLNDFDYLIQNFYVVDKTTTINSSQLSASELLSKSMKSTHSPDAPQILIYHTHSQEMFVDSVPGDMSTSIVGAGDYLTKLLGGYGFHVIHDTGQYDVESRDNAYSKAGPAVEKILRENPSIEFVIDLHRDGVPEGTHLTTEMNGKQMASIMFFNGLSRTTANGDIGYLNNPYIKDNLAFSLQMQLASEQYYPGFSRAIYLKGYRYNMHYCPKTLLVEVGAQTNTVSEVMNAMEPLADIIAKVITP